MAKLELQVEGTRAASVPPMLWWYTPGSAPTETIAPSTKDRACVADEVGIVFMLFCELRWKMFR